MLSGPPSTRNFHVFSIALPGLIVTIYIYIYMYSLTTPFFP